MKVWSKEYRVSICCEEGVVLHINATSEEEAKEKAEGIASYYAGTNYPSDYSPNTVHRDFFINDVEEV